MVFNFALVIHTVSYAVADLEKNLTIRKTASIKLFQYPVFGEVVLTKIIMRRIHS